MTTSEPLNSKLVSNNPNHVPCHFGRFFAIVLGAMAIGASGAYAVELRPSGGDDSDAINHAAKTSTDGLRFHGGIYRHAKQIIISRDSLALEAQGVSRWRRAGAFKGTAAAIFIYTGPTKDADGKPVHAWVISGDGISLRGINAWGGFYGDKPRGYGIEWRDWGKRDIQHCSFNGWERGWWFAPSNHNDCTTVTNVHFSHCLTSVLGEENQSSAIDWRGVFIHGEGDIAFDFPNGGGNYEFSTVALNMPRLLFRANTNRNTCTYSVRNLKVDNNAGVSAAGEDGWRLFEMQGDGPLNLTVRGHIGSKATPGAKALDVPDAALDGADVQMFWNGRIWTGKPEE
jgi:hypothetical protein